MTDWLLVDITVVLTVLGVLLYGAICDAKSRTIPDLVPMTVFAFGVIVIFFPEQSIWSIPLFERAAGFVLPTAALIILHLCKKPVGGGDFKLSATLGLLLGLSRFAMAYAIGGVIALAWAGIRKQKSVPLAVFLTIGVMVCLIL